MKIKVNNEDLFELSETQKKVIKNDIHEDEFEDDMKRRLKYILTHKYDECFKRLKAEWETKLVAKGVAQLPTNKDDFANLVFSQPEYKNRKQRDQEAKS
jgi:hypothetical protein